MKPSNLESIDSAMFELISSDEQTQVLGGAITETPTATRTLVKFVADVASDKKGDLPFI